MGRFKELEQKLKKQIRINVPTNSDKPGYSRMVRAEENGVEKLIYYGKKGFKELLDSDKSVYTKFAAKCNMKMSKLTPQYWECSDFMPRQQHKRNVWEKIKDKKG